MRENTPLTAGIDTAKDKLEVAIASSQQPVTLENAAVGWCQLAARLAAAGVGRVGIEASGGYERGVVEHLRRAGFTVLVLQPLQSLPRRRPGSRPGPECICGQSASAARVHLRRAKNDRIDAALIAACAAHRSAPCQTRHAAGRARRSPHLYRADRGGHRAPQDPPGTSAPAAPAPLRLRRLASSEITRLQRRREGELRRLRLAIQRHDDRKARCDLVLSVPGIGERTALAILIRLPELGSLSREQAAALAGLAPFDHDSGTHRGQRHIAGGRARLRRSLYAAALPAAFR
jgi:transposase